jgi:hypothetical protein
MLVMVVMVVHVQETLHATTGKISHELLGSVEVTNRYSTYSRSLPFTRKIIYYVILHVVLQNLLIINQRLLETSYLLQQSL